MPLPLLLAAFALVAPRPVSGAVAPPPALAQLQQRLALAQPAQRPALLTALAEQFEVVDPIRGVAPAREAVVTATDPREKLAAEVVLVTLLRDQGDYAAAKELSQAGLDRAIALGDDRMHARFCYELGRVEWSLADHAGALKLYHEAIRLGERSGDLAVLADAHLANFVIWEEFEERDLALANLELARGYAERLGDPRRLVVYYRGLGNDRIVAKDLAGARTAHERSRDLSAAAGHVLGYADALHNLAYISELQGQLDPARSLALQAAAIYDRLGLDRYQANIDCTLGRLLVKQGHYDEAIGYLDRALKLLSDRGGPSGVVNCYKQLIFAHKAAGHAALAADYQRKLDAATDAIFGEKSRQKISLLKAQFEIEHNQLQLDLLRRDEALKDDQLRRAQIERYALIAVGLLGALAAAAIVSRQRLKLRVERRILEETRLAHQAAEEADRLKTRLLGIASHDLKSPLAALIGCAKELEQAPGDALLVAEFAKLMREEGERMLTLVRDLLDMSAIESGRLRLAQDPCDLAGVVRWRLEAHRPAAEAKGQILAGVFPAGDPVIVSADTARLGQVFDNLISNAVKFTPRGKAIEVRVGSQAGRAIVQIRDSGPGLRPEDLGRLFQPFQTLSAQPTGGESSSGLGLFIAKQIVTLHGGTLGVDSAPGEGATFAVELPLTGAASAEPVLEHTVLNSSV